MTEALVRGVRLNYETIGSNGPWIALTPGSRRPYDELINISKAMSVFWSVGGVAQTAQ